MTLLENYNGLQTVLQIVFSLYNFLRNLVNCFTFVLLYLHFYIKHCTSHVFRYTIIALGCTAFLRELLGSRPAMYNCTLFCKRFCVRVFVVSRRKLAIVYLKNITYTHTEKDQRSRGTPTRFVIFLSTNVCGICADLQITSI